MNRHAPLAIMLLAAFVFPNAATAATTIVHRKPPKVHKVINSRYPGSPGFTGSSPLGSAQKAVIRAKKKAAKASH
jgi:hypothetical protein